MRVFSRFAAAAFTIGLIAGPAAAQMVGNPVYFSPKHGTGITIAGDLGRGLNDASFKTNYYGGRATIGLPMFTISAGAGVVKPSGVFDVPGTESEVTFGGNVALNVFNPPLAPVAVSLQGGVGYVKTTGSGVAGGDVTTLVFPLGVALAFSVPSPALSVEPWIAPRVHIVRTSNGTSTTETNFGVSAGLNLGLPMGLGFHAAIDYVAVSDPDDVVPLSSSSSDVSPFLVGVGVHYKIALPGLGIPGM